MKHYKVKKFANEAIKLKVTDALLRETRDHFLNIGEEGRQRSALGAGLHKLRLSTHEGKGKSGGSRTILAFQKNDQVIWLHLFAKNEKENVTTQELKKLKSLAGILLNLSDIEIERLIKIGELHEVKENV